ncbi:MAG: hypothetical protein ABI878_11475 [Acidobacteriota bacterium]
MREVPYRSVGDFHDGIASVIEGEHHFGHSFYVDTEGNEYY